jgi:EpsI family protein
VGFALRSAQSVNLPISPQAILPARRVVAYAGDRNENILYWARLGEQLPQTAADQRRVRLDNAMHGYVADGILVRFSLVGESEPSFKVLDDFVPAFLAAVNPATRPAMIGTQLARKMA